MTDWIFTVTQLNEYVRKSMAGDPVLRVLELQGEISGFKHQLSSGHWYFTLKDESSRISCVMFRQYQPFGFRPQDGMKVILKGSAGIYVPGGSYQFNAVQIRQDGLGDLHRRFEMLKAKMMAEGLFDPSGKRPMPRLPR